MVRTTETYIRIKKAIEMKAKKSRAEKRNEYAELVCRELRYYLAKASVEMGDKSSLMELLLKWMKFANKNKYERP